MPHTGMFLLALGASRDRISTLGPGCHRSPSTAGDGRSPRPLRGSSGL